MPDVRRDRYGRYLVVPPGGSRGPLGYTRATTVAKALDDGGGLIPWKATLAMTGMMRRPGLRGRFEALMTANPERGPWYGSLDSKDASKKLVEECAEAGGSSDRADQGTALHAIFEQFDLGKDVIPAQESTKLDLDAYHAAIRAAGIGYDRSVIEAMVVLDEYQVAGTADRLACEVPGFDLLLVGDLKTGDDLRYSWQAISIQLAIYAHADNVYIQGEAADGSQDQRLAMPRLSREHALVMHSPAGQARTDLYVVDIAAGWEAFKTSIWARQWRSRKDLAKPYQRTTLAPTIVAASIEPPPFDDAAVTEEVPATSSVTLAPAEQYAALSPIRNEGGLCDDDAAVALERAYHALAPSRRDWVTSRAREAIQHDVSFHLRNNRTTRRFEILRAAVALSGQYDTDPPESVDECVRALLLPILGDVALFPVIELGHLFGALGAAEASAFARSVDAFIAGAYVASIDEATAGLRLTLAVSTA